MSSPASNSPVLPEVFGPYRIVKPLGKGGMGAVYLARDTRLDRDVALKVCTFADNPQAMERFRREAKAAANLSHTNLCPVYEFDVRDGIAYITMAFVEGPTLNAWIAHRGSISQRDAARLIARLAVAMQVAHDAGVIHRDLKPSNVVINKKGEPIILDFGLARQMDEEGTRLTQVGSIYGTPSYMAPEQAGGDPALVGPACDIYSLGVMLYELLTGRVPFEGTFTAVMGQLLTAKPLPVRSLNPAVDASLEAICMRTLAKAPHERQPSMKEFARSLVKLAPSLSTTAASNPPTLRAMASTTPEAQGKRRSVAARDDIVMLKLSDEEEVVALPVAQARKASIPPPLPPTHGVSRGHSRTRDEREDRPRQRRPESSHATAWIIGGVSAALVLILIAVVVAVVRNRDSSGDDSSGSSEESREAFRVATDRKISGNNLRQIGLALHAYHSAWNRLPPPVIKEPGTGRSLYSWRVAILPYIEQDPLYQLWNKQQPWDSDANRALWSQMPKTYLMPGRKGGDPTQTYYQVVTGMGTAFGNPDGTPLTSITDGTSNTIMVVEASNPVLWCAPNDVPFLPSKEGFSPRLVGGHFGKSSVHAILCDGSLRVIPWTMSPFDFQNAITINDGMPINWPD